jgi:hypothetical protein
MLFSQEDPYETYLYECADAWSAVFGGQPPTEAWSKEAYHYLEVSFDDESRERTPWERFHAELTEEIAYMAARKAPPQPS